MACAKLDEKKEMKDDKQCQSVYIFLNVCTPYCSGTLLTVSCCTLRAGPMSTEKPQATSERFVMIMVAFKISSVRGGGGDFFF